MVNAELFRKIADKIEKEPKSYDQERYASPDDCGCIFHLAEIISGQTMNLPWQTGPLLGLSEADATKLYSQYWKPRPDLTVPQALRLIADGESVSEVSA